MGKKSEGRSKPIDRLEPFHDVTQHNRPAVLIARWGSVIVTIQGDQDAAPETLRAFLRAVRGAE